MNHRIKKRETLSQKNASLGRKEWPCNGGYFESITRTEHAQRRERRLTDSPRCEFFVNQQFSRVSGNLLPLLYPSVADGLLCLQAQRVIPTRVIHLTLSSSIAFLIPHASSSKVCRKKNPTREKYYIASEWICRGRGVFLMDSVEFGRLDYRET